jgi:anti-sigma factor RsiW
MHLRSSGDAALVVREVVDSQIRGWVMEASYNQIAPQPGVIRQWFQDKVEFAVLVPNLPQERYTFVGARVNYFLDRRVAELAYTTETHTLSFVMFPHRGLDLTAVPTEHLGTRPVHVQRYKGYSTVLWQDGEVLCGFVSDLSVPELLRLTRDVTGHMSAS